MINAPDKIYISIERTYEASNGQVIGMATNHSERHSDDDIEYIRKDALIEKLAHAISTSLALQPTEPGMIAARQATLAVTRNLLKYIQKL